MKQPKKADRPFGQFLKHFIILNAILYGVTLIVFIFYSRSISEAVKKSVADGYDSSFCEDELFLLTESKNYGDKLSLKKRMTDITWNLYYQNLLGEVRVNDTFFMVPVSIAFVGYDKKTGEIIGSEPATVLYTDKLSYIQFMEPYIKEVPAGTYGLYSVVTTDEMKEIWEKYGSSPHSYQIRFQDLYFDGVDFYPGKMLVYSYQAGNEMVSMKPIKEIVVFDETKNYIRKLETDYTLYYTYESANQMLLSSLKDSVEINAPYYQDVEKDICQNKDTVVWQSAENNDYVCFFVARWTYSTIVGLCFKEYLPFLIFGTVVLLPFSVLWTAFSCEKKRTKKLVAQYQKDLTRTLAHDIKTPLMIMNGYAENLKDNIHSEKKDYYCDKIIENGKHINHLVENVLELTTLDQKQILKEKETLHFLELIKEVLETYSGAIADRKLKVSLQGETVGAGNRKLMLHVFENLISNIVRYCPEEGVVLIDLYPSKIIFQNDSQEKQKNGLGLSLAENFLTLQGHTLQTQEEDGRFIVTIIIS